jgi:hypothetical protein
MEIGVGMVSRVGAMEASLSSGEDRSRIAIPWRFCNDMHCPIIDKK